MGRRPLIPRTPIAFAHDGQWETLLHRVMRDEGFAARPYRDTEGVLTIGFGTNLEAGITHDQAQAMLELAMLARWDDLTRRKTWVGGLPLPARRALANMAYNLGVPRLLGFRRMWAALERGDYRAAADEALDSRWAEQVGARAQRIADDIRRCA